MIGWKECAIPQELLADSLSFKAVLFRTHEVWAQDGRSFRRYAERGENTEIPFTLRQNKQFSYLSGATHTGDLQAAADLTLGQIDLKGTVRLICPQTWIDAVASWQDTEQPDMIGDWHLYRGDTLLSDTGLQAIRAENDALCFDLLYPRLEDTQNLRLVPAYTGSGAHPLEAILLEAPVNR